MSREPSFIILGAGQAVSPPVRPERETDQWLLQGRGWKPFSHSWKQFLTCSLRPQVVIGLGGVGVRTTFGCGDVSWCVGAMCSRGSGWKK